MKQGGFIGMLVNKVTANGISVVKNVTRGSQEPNLAFLLGAMVQYSPI